MIAEADSLASRIVIVDDEPDVADSLGMLLSLEGYTVDVAYDGPAAIELISRLRPKLVLLDLGMPKMHGYEVAARLQRIERLAGVEIVAISGFAQPADLERSKAAGLSHHLVKPVEPEALLELVQRLVPATSAPR